MTFEPVYTDEVLKWLTLSANGGYSTERYCLANYYYFGEEVEQNYIEAVKWYRIAAKHSDSLSQEALGRSYYYGHGVEQDLTEAIKLYKLAAEQDYEDTKVKLKDVLNANK